MIWSSRVIKYEENIRCAQMFVEFFKKMPFGAIVKMGISFERWKIRSQAGGGLEPQK